MKQNEKLVTAADFSDNIFSGFNNDRERLKYMKSSGYNKMNLVKAFSIYYGTEPNVDVVKNKAANTVIQIELGNVYLGTVTEFTDRYIAFTLPGVKSDIICKESFTDCRSSIENYLLTHDNKMLFEVREHTDGKYIVSVLNAYYRQWMDNVNKSIKNNDGIDVHIDDLVQGGYVCHTSIDTLNKLTGKTYTHSVFIPGSHIVLNIENDFERWIGQDVSIIPQKFTKFVDFRKNYKTVENSLVGSRKKILQFIGNQNLADLYTVHKLIEDGDTTIERETFTGIVTGPLNSTTKVGIFVELKDKYITGFLPVDEYDLLEYKKGDEIQVKIKEFETQQVKELFVKENGKIVKCHVRPVFELA